MTILRLIVWDPAQVMSFPELFRTSVLLVSFLVASYGIGAAILEYIWVSVEFLELLIFSPIRTLKYITTKIDQSYNELKEEIKKIRDELQKTESERQ